MLFLTTYGFCQETLIEVRLYNTTKFFVRKRVTHPQAIAVVNDQSDMHLTIKKFVDPKTGKKIKDQQMPWAIEYADNKYLNMSYAGPFKTSNLFVKFTLTDRWSIVTIPENATKQVKNAGSQAYGALSADLYQNSRGWLDEKGVKHKIIYLDTYDIFKKGKNGPSNDSFRFLTYAILNKLLPKENGTKNAKEMSLEEVISTFDKLNQF